MAKGNAGKHKGKQKNLSIKQETQKKKVIKKEKTKRICYSREDVTSALREVMLGKSVSYVARKYNIPDSTIRSKKQGKYADKKPGPCTVLSMQEENDLVDWIFQCFDRGFTVSKPQLVESVKGICIRLNKKNPFPGNKPGRSWFEGFLKRHPQVNDRITTNIQLNKEKVTEVNLRNWFDTISKLLDNEKLKNIEPNRVFSSEEIMLPLNPTKKVSKNHEIDDYNEKDGITVLVTVNAAGNLAPIVVLYAGKCVPNDVIKMAPAEIGLGYSENGKMFPQNFYEYIYNVFDPWLTKNQVKRPVILYIRGRFSHITVHLSKYCSDRGIVLIGLPPNASQIIEPTDILFTTLKVEWPKAHYTFCQNSKNRSIELHQFAPLLKTTLGGLDFQKMLQNSFKRCGLYPFSANALDFNALFNQDQDPLLQTTNNDVNALQDISDSEKSNALKVIESLLTEEQLQSFHLNPGPVWKGVTRDESLYVIWFKLVHPNFVHDMNNTPAQQPYVFNTEVQVDREMTTETFVENAVNTLELECVYTDVNYSNKYEYAQVYQ